MKMKKFKKSPKKTKTIVISAVAITLLIGGIYLYKTYALYEEKKEFNLLKGRIVDFRKNNKDIEISAIVNGKPSEEIPNKESGYIVEEVYCTNNAEGVWDNEEWVLNIKNLSTSKTTCSLNFYPKSFNEFIIAKSVGNEEIEKFEHKETEQTPALTDYRYIGENPKNYVCFGSEENPCPEENLYRIIGVIPTQSEENGRYLNRVKLVKYKEYIGENMFDSNPDFNPTPSMKGYQWNTNNNNNWEESTTQSNVLNGKYWNDFGEYQQYIAPAKWYLGATDYTKYDNGSYTSNSLYNDERSYTKSLNDGKISFIANIGLMYPSDYGFSMGKLFENQNISNENITKVWLNTYQENYWEWLLTPFHNTNSSLSSATYIVPKRKLVHIAAVRSFGNMIRPTFYLKETIGYKSGNGTKTNPYRLFK